MNIDNEINFLFQQATYANSNKKPIRYKSLFQKLGTGIIIFIAGFVLCFSFISNPSVSALNSFNSVKEEYINTYEKKAYKNIVKQISIKENRHPNSIHAELRKKFNYRSYLYLTKEQYEKIYTYLKTRL